jgi:hypothetical protein
MTEICCKKEVLKNVQKNLEFMLDSIRSAPKMDVASRTETVERPC